MTEYAEVWHLTRQRLDEIVADLNDRQSNWRPFPKGHTVNEYLYHVAGVEYFYYKILTGAEPESDLDKKLIEAVASDFLKEGPFPFKDDDLTVEKARAALKYSSGLLAPVIENPTAAQLHGTYISAQNAQIDGRGALVRVSQHAGYHNGQIYLMRCDPNFPTG